MLWSFQFHSPNLPYSKGIGSTAAPIPLLPWWFAWNAKPCHQKHNKRMTEILKAIFLNNFFHLIKKISWVRTEKNKHVCKVFNWSRVVYFLMTFLWLCHGFLVWLSPDFPMIFSWLSHDLFKTFYAFIMTFSWLSHDSLMIFSLPFHDFLMTLSWIFHRFLRNFSGLSQDFLMTFSGLSHAFLITFSWLSQDFIMTFSQTSQDFIMTLSWHYQDFLISFSWISHEVLIVF